LRILRSYYEVGVTERGADEEGRENEEEVIGKKNDEKWERS
jgi:hypothetical protein